MEEGGGCGRATVVAAFESVSAGAAGAPAPLLLVGDGLAAKKVESAPRLVQENRKFALRARPPKKESTVQYLPQYKRVLEYLSRYGTR